MNDRGRAGRGAQHPARPLFARPAARALTWFWFNHFNVHLYKSNIRVLIGDYEDRAIRPHALGRFRDLLAATLRHPGDAALSRQRRERRRPHQRELCPRDHGAAHHGRRLRLHPERRAGAGADPDRRRHQSEDRKIRSSSPNCRRSCSATALFEFNPARHDYGDKIFLGHTIKGRGLAEVDEALDILCRQPATATRIFAASSRSISSRDNPPAALVERMAQTFQRPTAISPPC